MSTPVGPYTPVVRAGDFVLTSGQIGIADGALVERRPPGRARTGDGQPRHRARVGRARRLADVVKTTVFLTDMADYAEMNEVYTAALGDHRPARSAVAVAALPIGAAVEIEAVAHVPA